MKIQEKAVASLRPYENNTKIHTPEQVDEIARSIQKFGWKQPIVADSNGVIIVGHGRYEAAKKLGLKKVPVVVADDLSEDEIRAYRIADNKANESEWDFKALRTELDSINLDMSLFGIDESFGNFEDDADDDWDDYEKEDQHLRTFNATNFLLFDPDRTEGRYGMPTLRPVDHIPKHLVGFNYVKISREYDACIHFYLDDFQFERVWNRPQAYVNLLSKFDSVMTPNFSIYLDMPDAIKIWNTYRARLLGQFYQDNGMTVIPIVYWSDPSSYEWCFDGIPEGGTISVNNIGNAKNKEARELWFKGMDELLERKKPKRILLYGNGIKEDYDFGSTEVLYYKNTVTERLHASDGRKQKNETE